MISLRTAALEVLVILMQLIEMAEEAYGSLGGELVLADCPYAALRGHASCGRCLVEALYGMGPSGLTELCGRRRWSCGAESLATRRATPASLW